MQKHLLIIILVISLTFNFYLAGNQYFTSADTSDINRQDIAQAEQLQERIEKLQEEKESLQEKINNLQLINPPGTNSQNANPEGISGEKDSQIYRWYYMRQENAPPRTEPHYVKMLENRGYYLGDTSKKKIYITFDEGYENGYTSKILDTLKSNNVKAAFFVTGSYVDNNPELVKRMANEGHIIGNHSDTHPSLSNLSNEEIKEELNNVKDKVKDLTGQDVRYFRPPRGEFSERVLDIAAGEGYTTIFWSLAHVDWLEQKQPGKEAAYNFIVNNIHNGAIVLLHAVSESNAKALDSIIKELKEMGYEFATLDQL